MIKWPSINLPNLSSKDRNDFDSILPISYSSDKNKKSFMGYIYDTSSSIGTAISGSCQNGFFYLAEVAGSVVSLGRSPPTSLPKTQQDTQKPNSLLKYFTGSRKESEVQPVIHYANPQQHLVEKWTPITTTPETIRSIKTPNSLF